MIWKVARRAGKPAAPQGPRRSEAPERRFCVRRAFRAEPRHDPRRTQLRRHRNPQRRGGAAPPSGGRHERLGPRAPLRRLGRPRGDRRAALRRAAAQVFIGLAARRGDAASRSPRRLEAIARSRRRRDRGPVHRRGPRAAAARAHVAGDYPEWLAPAFAESFGAEAAEAGRALAGRAPVDLRVNLLKSSQEKALAALAHLFPVATPFSPIGLRIAVRPDGRGVALSAEPAYVRGLVEVQDEGSQLATLLSGAKPGQQVLDLCAGAGGKTLALAGMMAN